MFESVPFESSSRVKLGGDRPPPTVNEKSCASFGCESFTIVSDPFSWLTKVHVTVSFGPTSMFDTGLPSLQVALVSPHPDGTVCEIE